jgi:hypothetical protein
MALPVQTVRPLVDYLGGKDVTAGFKNTYGNVMAGQQSATQAAVQNRLNSITTQRQQAADLVARSASAANANAQRALQQRQDQANAIAAKQAAAQQAAQQHQIAQMQAQLKAAQQHANTLVHSAAPPVANGGSSIPGNVGADNGQGIHYSPGAVAGGSTAVWGDPRSPGWKANNLVTFKSGKISVTVNRQASTAFKGFLNQLTRGGYHLSSVQGYNLRDKRMGTGLSEHAFGTAIDINPSQNPNTGSPRLVTNLPTWVGALAARYGLIWGGTWNNTKDPMHFEYVAPSQRGLMANTSGSLTGAGVSVRGGPVGQMPASQTTPRFLAKPAPAPTHRTIPHAALAAMSRGR